MNRFVQFCLAVVLLTGISASAQANGQAKPAAAAKPAASSNSAVPSEATVNAFLKAIFGWNQELTWKVAEIKPSEAAGISQATVILNTPKGPQTLKFFITSDEKYAFPGELMPFGTDPFAPNRQE